MSAMRPSRFSLHLPVWYRANGEQRWHTGVTENVSRTGAVIRTPDAKSPRGAVTVVIQLPGQDGGTAGGCLTGVGRVVRRGSAADESSFAIVVKHYRVQRRDRIPVQHA